MTTSRGPQVFLTATRPRSELQAEAYDELVSFFEVFESFNPKDAENFLVDNFNISRSNAVRTLNGLLSSGSIERSDPPPTRVPLTLGRQPDSEISKRVSSGGSFRPPQLVEKSVDVRDTDIDPEERFGVN